MSRADPVDVLFGRNLRALRAARGWSLQVLADESGVAPATANRCEHGRPVFLSNAVRLADALGVPLGDMLLEPPR